VAQNVSSVDAAADFPWFEIRTVALSVSPILASVRSRVKESMRRSMLMAPWRRPRRPELRPASAAKDERPRIARMAANK
jgi:hypothetical protein